MGCVCVGGGDPPIRLLLKNISINVVTTEGDRLSPGRVAQSVTCLAKDASLPADPGVASSIPARSHTFMEIDHEIS